MRGIRTLVVGVLLLAGVSVAAEQAARPTDVELRSLVPGLNALTMQLFRRMDAEGNVAFSGLTAAGALALAAPGARGETRAEFERLLPLEAGDAALVAGLRQLLGAGDGQCVLGAASSAFVDEGLELLPAYADTLARAEAPVVRVPFRRAIGEARAAIDRWARESTRGRIVELATDVNVQTRLVVASALHFSADWAQPFSTSMTEPAPFRLASGEKVDVPTMRTREVWRFARTDGVRIVEIPYRCGRLSMLLIAPDRDDGEDADGGGGTGLGLAGLGRRGGGVERPLSMPLPPKPRREPVEARSLASIEAALTPAKLAEWVGAMQRGYLHVLLPRFQVRTEVDLEEALVSVGIRRAFSGQADFSGISTTRLQIDAVPFRTVVEVDEAGTRAASAAGVVLGSRGTGPKAVRFDFDRPFLFAIRDGRTGAILLLGRVADPREWASTEAAAEPEEQVPAPEVQGEALGGLKGGAGLSPRGRR